MPPSLFSGRAGRWGVQSLPSLNRGLPDSMRADSASTVAVTAEVDMASASSSDTSRPATGLRPAAARVRGSFDAPMEEPRAVFEAVVLLSDLALVFLAGLGFAASVSA